MITEKAKALVVAMITGLGLSACSSIDCPLNNRTYASFKLAGDVTKLVDTLTVSTPRNIDNPEEDTVLINRLVDTDSLSLPMSYQRTEDIYIFTFVQKDTELKTIDTLWVSKENEPHFESVECNPVMFHTIKDVRFTQRAIDDIKVNYNKVTYNDAKAHFLIYLKNRGN
ncbi:MAG: DUF6452 family protein [Prevotella sp.]|uniref:DUF6452 family protein n=1 Tax=Prevotella sp. TaxID=59823 RepID=UPI0025D3483B|nr:DUF6452 family protein [Prevotella sp.]MCI7119717.1 DUF6452 family protein [Prevotella sp.]